MAIGTRIGAAALAMTLVAGLPVQAQDMSDAEFGDKVREYILANPDVIREALMVLEQRRLMDEAKAEQEMLASARSAIYEDGFSWVGGNPDGDITVVEFLDYRCGYCKRAHDEVNELISSDGNIRYIVKEFPILGPESVTASQAAIAALMVEGPEKYQAFHNALMAYSGPINDATLERLAASADVDMDKVRAKMDDPEVARRIDETQALARSLKISGTPTFIIGGEFVRGYIPLDDMRQVVDHVRKRDG